MSEIGRRTFLAASGVSLAHASAAGLLAPQRHVIENGFICAGGQTMAGWYAGVIVLDHREPVYCEGPRAGPDWNCRYDGAPFETEFEKARKWREAVVNRPRVLVLRTEAVPDQDSRLVEAERILGPAAPCAITETPMLTWTERQHGQWQLRFFDGAGVKGLYSAGGILRSPAVARFANGFIFACERDGGSGPEVLVFDETGHVMARLPGSRPRLAASGHSLFVLLQRSQSNSISSRVVEMRDGRIKRDIDVPSSGDYTWNGDIAYDPENGKVLVVLESCPAFGIDEQLGRYRELHSWAMAPEKGEFTPWPGKGGSAAECASFEGRNAAPLLPRLFRLDGKPAVAYRQYRFIPQRGGSGWDVWASRAGENGWMAPARITENYGTADTGFALLERPGGTTVGIFPCRELPEGGAIARKYWVEVVETAGRPELPTTFVGAANLVKCSAPARVRDIAIDAGMPGGTPPGMQLIYGDLHLHSAYSTCQPATNGMPEDALRFHRDVLACEVLTLTEHGHHMIEPESIYVLDRIEEFAGDRCIILYGDEPNPLPGRHTNFFTIRRDVFEELRTIFLSHGRGRADVYRHIKQALPLHSVLAIRHFHGNVLRGEALRASFDPELEVAMEAMQVRLNAMLQVTPESKNILFPNECLDLGLRIGLVGGTDHTSGARLNTFCLTGFWVRERTAQSVFEALRARRTIAMSNGKIAIWATLDGRPMGTEVTVKGKVSVRAGLSCGRQILRAGLMRDGKVLQWIPVGSKHASLELTDPEPPSGHHWYVVTAEMETAYKQSGYGHASPFFVTVRE